MGLLDDFGTFIKTPEGQGLLGAAFGGLSTAGRIGVGPLNSLGIAGMSGLQGYQSGLNQQREQMQMDLLKQQIASATRRNDLISGMLGKYVGQTGDDFNGPQQALAAGAKVGDVGPTVTNAARIAQFQPAASAQGASSSMIGNVPSQAIAHDLAFNDGKNIGEWMYKQGVPDMQVSNGYAYNKNELKPGFLPQLNVSQNGQTSMVTIGPDGQPIVSAPRGAVDTYKGYQGAQRQAENENTLAPLDRINPSTGRPYVATVQQLIDEATGKTPRNYNLLPPQTRAAIQADADNSGKPVGVNFRLQNGASVEGNVNPSGFAGFAGPADLERTKADIEGRQGTLNEINKNWITSSYNPAVEAGQQATSAKANITALRGIDLKTGSGTESRAAFANFLTGFGVAPDNAKMFATNAQRFQSVAMNTLLDKFVAQKGPQTEGDAKRVQATFAQLSNTPDANQFLADFAEAQANMAIRRAAFYQEAQPVARQEGDLTRVDREWKNIQGSIWDDPLMRKWRNK